MTQLAVEATVGVSSIAEGLHQAVWSALGAPGGGGTGRTRGVTGLVYSSVRGITRLVGGCVTGVMGELESRVGPPSDGDKDSLRREAVLAALNGVMGDHLVATDNPLAVPMSLRSRGAELKADSLPQVPHATGKILLFVHGLCMSDRHWSSSATAHGVVPGNVLASELACTPVYLRYNSGLPVARNGLLLSELLEELLIHWPVPVEELTAVTHSMGGLLMRSAVHGAAESGARWPTYLKKIVFLGTPHHGAPLEQVGGWVDRILTSTPFTAPFAALGRLRSAGITDLRHGTVLGVDDSLAGPIHGGHPGPQHLPLPEGVACFAVAATTAPTTGVLADHLVGDGLVPVHSALGRHHDPRRCLRFPEGSQRVFRAMSHLEMLTHHRVVQQTVEWLRATPQC
jgi:hypothetical protein